MRARVTRRWTSYKGQPVIPVIRTRGHSGPGDVTGAIPTDRRLCANRSRAQTTEETLEMIADRAIRTEINRVAHQIGQRAAQEARQRIAERLEGASAHQAPIERAYWFSGALRGRRPGRRSGRAQVNPRLKGFPCPRSPQQLPSGETPACWASWRGPMDVAATSGARARAGAARASRRLRPGDRSTGNADDFSEAGG